MATSGMIGLIAAMPQESDALLRCIQDWKRSALGSLRAVSFELGGQPCVLVTSGMGERRAGAAARALIEACAPRVLISFGIAGAVEADVRIGDAVAVETVCRLERGTGNVKPFLGAAGRSGNVKPFLDAAGRSGNVKPFLGAAGRDGGTILRLAAWPEAARDAAARALAERGARLLAGTAVTTGGSQGLGDQLEHLVHPVLEMETAGIAQVAAETGIPLLALRAISDGPAAPIPFDVGEVMDEDANLRGGKLLRAILRRPGVVFKFGQVVRNSRIAAENAAIALVAALREGGYGTKWVQDIYREWGELGE